MIRSIQGFNSILVRLKGICGYCVKRFGISFQFHTGSIKRCGIRSAPRQRNKFQFHTGSIKRNYDAIAKAADREFQFHTGSIKRKPNWKQVRLHRPFQFHTGSIKSQYSDYVFRYYEIVSIPYWFD